MTKLKPSDSAPTFRLHDVFGRMVDLEEYRDKKILIGFFRHAGCPFCNLRVHALTKLNDDLKRRGMEMIFFFESKETVILRSTFHKEISPIPLISDPQKVQYKAYGLEESALKSAISHATSFVPTVMKARNAGTPVHWMKSGESLNTMPAEFLINKGLKIERTLYSERLNDRIEVDEILKFSLT